MSSRKQLILVLGSENKTLKTAKFDDIAYSLDFKDRKV